jgi:hypothetical protein
MSSEMSLSLNSVMTMQATSASGTGVAVAGAHDITCIFPKATSGKLAGSDDAGSNFNDIEGTAFTGDGTIVPSVTLLNCQMERVRAVFAGTGALAVFIRRINRVAPSPDLDRTKNKTVSDPEYGTA